MDIQELNQDRKMISAGLKANAYIDRGFSKQAKSKVNTHAVIGGIALALPALGFDNILYAIILWHMYYSLCALAKQSFGSNMTKSFIGGFCVNFLVCSLLELVVAWFPIGGIIGAFAIGAGSIKLSGAAYLKALEILHDGNVAERYDTSAVLSGTNTTQQMIER